MILEALDRTQGSSLDSECGAALFELCVEVSKEILLSAFDQRKRGMDEWCHGTIRV